MASSLEGGEEGTQVAKGNHVVPKGVAVEELDRYDRSGKLAKECPQSVSELMIKNGCSGTYESMVNAIVNERSTRNILGKWQDAEVISIIDLYRNEFAEHGIKVVLCKRSSGSGNYRWIEYIDMKDTFAAGGPYVPQYDVANYSGQVIKTMYKTLKFPNGVAVEEFKRYKSRRTLRERIPTQVENLLIKKNLLNEYNILVDHIIEAGDGDRKWSEWDNASLKEIAQTYTLDFEKKGVSVFICHKVEYVSHGQYGGHNEHFRWIEFVDRSEQPNYYPQREANDHSCEQCIVQ